MNLDDLATVQYGDAEGFNRFLFENYLQHVLFKDVLAGVDVVIPQNPIADADPQDVGLNLPIVTGKQIGRAHV